LRRNKILFACIEFKEPQYSYMGIRNTTRYLDKYEKVKRSDTFTLHYYPSKQEIINILLPYHEECKCINIISYNEMSKQQYDAFNI
jgi:hypothetical protein